MAVRSISYNGDILEMVSYGDENLPKYWQTYFDEKAVELRNADLALGRNGVSFAFVTDVHWDTNAKYSPMLLSYLAKHTNVNDVICGGDVISGHSTDKDEAVAQLYEWSNATRNLHIVNILGNHDCNTSDQTNWDAVITDSEFYGAVSKNSEEYVNYADGKLYGFSDNTNQKVRYIYLNSGYWTSDLASDANISMPQEQIDWLKARISELSAGWGVIVFSHIAFDYRTNQLHQVGTQIKTALDSIYDDVNATIIGVVSGHVHDDIHEYSTKGYPIIATTCDTLKDGMESETVTEQAFDLFYVNTEEKTINTIRIGNGENRSFTYGTPVYPPVPLEWSRGALQTNRPDGSMILNETYKNCITNPYAKQVDGIVEFTMLDDSYVYCVWWWNTLAVDPVRTGYEYSTETRTFDCRGKWFCITIKKSDGTEMTTSDANVFKCVKKS